MNLLTLETHRLTLSGLTPEDINYMFTHLSKLQIKDILGLRSEADYLKEEHKHINGYSSYNRSFLLFLLTDKTSGRIIGRCGLHNWNKEHRRAEIGYVMQDERFQGQGLMSEAVQVILDYGFNKLEINRIEALVPVGNVPSLRILEKFNFKQEGVLRQHLYLEGKYEDSLLFSMLIDEYKESKSGV